MIILIALALIFAAVTLVLLQFMPKILELFSGWQEKKVKNTSDRLSNVFVVVPRKKLIYLHIVSPIIFAGVGLFLTRNILGVAIGLGLGLIIPQILAKSYEGRRRQKFRSQLVDSLMILSGSLKAGLSLLQSFEALVEEMPAPVSEEFNLVLRENRMGVPLEDCLKHLKKRMHLEDLDLIITAILVAREAGGDLTQTFSQLVFTIREKENLSGKVKALTVQGRLQGIIMSILPLAFAAFAYKANPSFFDIMLKEKIGQIMLIYACISYVIGVVLIKIFSKVEV